MALKKDKLEFLKRMMFLSFPDDAVAFSQLPQLYEEFLIDVQTSARWQNLT